MSDGIDGGTSQRVHDLMLRLDAELRRRYGDRELSDEDVRAFLRERLAEEGRSPAEIEEMLGAE